MRIVHTLRETSYHYRERKSIRGRVHTFLIFNPPIFLAIWTLVALLFGVGILDSINH